MLFSFLRPVKANCLIFENTTGDQEIPKGRPKLPLS